MIILFHATIKNCIYYIHPDSNSKMLKLDSRDKSKSKKIHFEASTVQKDDLKIRFRRLGYISPALVENMDKCYGIKGLLHIKNSNFECETCNLNKHRDTFFKPLSQIRSKQPLELLQTNS